MRQPVLRRLRLQLIAVVMEMVTRWAAQHKSQVHSWIDEAVLVEFITTTQLVAVVKNGWPWQKA